MKKRDKQIKSVADLIKNLKKDISLSDAPIWYRGHSKKEWKLLPAFARPGQKLSEQNLIKKFKQNATLLLNPRPISDFDWSFIMQHHGVKTRLLDWTESPLTATYFSVREHPNTDGVLWVLLPVELNKFSNIRPDFAHDIPSFEDEALKNYPPASFAGETISRLFPVAALAPRNNPRMQSQLSVFTISHRDQTPIEEIGDGNHIWRYIIPKRFKDQIRKELKLLGIDKFQLFPELSSIGEMLHGEL